MECQFGANGSLVDFYHLCDYLSAAAKALGPHPRATAAWLSSQKERLKSRRAEGVLQTIEDHLETPEIPDAEAPVRSCHRYLGNRMGQVDYQSALARDLPIGSGEIESAHRYVVQQRLKRPGAWCGSSPTPST